jgi:hypothetical protein
MSAWVPVVAPIPHGSLSRYKHGRCRCADCRRANAAYQRDYMGAASADPVREARRLLQRRMHAARQRRYYRQKAGGATLDA